MNAMQPLICKDCWPKKTNHYEPCEHAMQVYNQGVQAGKEAIRERLETQSVDVAPAEGNEALTQPQAVSAGARSAEPVTPQMMSEVFAKIINNTDPEHPHLYDHRIAATELNRRLAAHDQKVRAEVLEEVVTPIAAEAERMWNCFKDKKATKLGKAMARAIAATCDAHVREIRALALPAGEKP